MDGNEITKTYGEKAVGGALDSLNSSDIEAMNKKFASVIDKMDYLKRHTASAEQKRLYSIAITQIQQAQMWALKAITWND